MGPFCLKNGTIVADGFVEVTMELFDTFIFGLPIACSECGKEIASAQSKNFGSTLDTYRVGDAIRDCDIRLGIIKEQCYCDSCSGTNGAKENDAWIVIWHGVYAGAFKTYDAAEARLNSVDRSTLLEWHSRQQTEKEGWQRRFRSFYAAVEEWHKYSIAEDKEAFLKKPLALIRSNLLDHMQSDDPLGDILEGYCRDIDMGDLDGSDLVG